MKNSKYFVTKLTLKAYDLISSFYSFWLWKRWRRDESEILSQISQPIKNVKVALQSQKILVVIPFRDKWELTEQCLKSLVREDLGPHRLEVVLVNNGSVEEKTKNGMSHWLEKSKDHIRFHILDLDIPFNFSVINNRAVEFGRKFNPDLVLLLNNDIEFIETSSIQSMVDGLHCSPDVDLLGCTLLYPDRSIQHLFVFPGSKIVGAHPYKGKHLSFQGPWFDSVQKVPAVTGAVMLMKMESYLDLGGFDESLPNCYQDVDLCIKVVASGGSVATNPKVKMIHHETQTRKPIPHWREVQYMYNKWHRILEENPGIPRIFSRWSEQLNYAIIRKPYPWKKLKGP